MKIIRIVALILYVVASDPSTLYMAQRLRALQDNQHCATISPYYDLHYGSTKIQELKGIYFCDQYAKRTCCTEQNFHELKLKQPIPFFYYPIHTDGSKNIPKSTIFHQFAKNFSRNWFVPIVTGTLARELGREFAQGFVINFSITANLTCFNMEKNILDFVEKQLQRFNNIYKNDIFCSELRYIVNDGEQFCSEMGYKVNHNNNQEEWIDNLLTNTTIKNPICWDTTPSSKIFGPAFTDKNSEKNFENFKENMKAKTKSFSGIIFSIVFLVVLVVGSLYLIKKLKV